MDLSLIKTIVVVMMENRSFDNLLGYLSLPPWSRHNVEGLGKIEDWEDRYASVYKGHRYKPFLLTDPYHPIPADPPHERGPIALQMGASRKGVLAMDGFVSNYVNAKERPVVSEQTKPPVMGYFTEEQAPVTHFFADNFAICDHWHASLAAGTQPNRLMAMSGYSKIDVNQVPLPEQTLVYDWLNARGISWRVYHEEMPFYAMMLSWIPEMLTGTHFRPLEQLFSDVENTPPGEFPQVVFIEPAYTDAPHIGVSTDDHAPSAIRGGQEFLLEVYRSVTADPDFWKGVVMIVTYDEHGGFFDHVSPPAVRTAIPQEAHYTNAFETLGVRVPSFVISPFVDPRSVFSKTMDHTSILKLIGSKFGGGQYSAEVDQRSVANIFELLTEPKEDKPAPVIGSLEAYLAKAAPMAGFVPGSAPTTTVQDAFQNALDRMRDHGGPTPEKIARILRAFPRKS